MWESKIKLKGDVGGGGRDPKKQKNLVPLFKKDKKNNLISPGRRRLVHHYSYKVPVLHVVKYHFMSPW